MKTNIPQTLNVTYPDTVTEFRVLLNTLPVDKRPVERLVLPLPVKRQPRPDAMSCMLDALKKARLV